MNLASVPRRQALALMLGSCSNLLPRILRADDGAGPVRLAISENVLGDVNLNDARVALQLWIKRLVANLNVAIDQKLFSSTQEIVDRAHKGDLDAVALNTLEYRLIAPLMDQSQIVNAAGDAGFEQYLLLVKKSSGCKQLSDLKGRRLSWFKSPKMCLAGAWLSTALDEGRLSPAEQFFASITTETKASRVVLPVFFGQADCCLATRRAFETMAELNPQVGRDMTALATSPALVVSFYVFRKNYRGPERQKLIRAISSLRSSVSGQELATLFQFDDLAVRDGSSLSSALAMLDAADRVRARQRTGVSR